jgi:hypothetical protein
VLEPPMHARARPQAVLLLAALAASLNGCALWPSPPPPPIPRPDVVEAVRAQSRGFGTVKDTEKVRLSVRTTVDGKTSSMPTLGGAMAFNAELPGLYLYAEKLTHHVFTLKALRSRFSLEVPETREVLVGGPVAYAKMPQILRPDEVKNLFAGPDILGLSWPGTEMSVEDDDYRFDVRVGNTLRRQVRVDRRQLVVTQIITYDSLGRSLTVVDLGDYDLVQGRMFPHRLGVERPRVGVAVVLTLSHPQLDVDLPEKTFRPTERRGWTVIDLDYQDISAARFFQEYR